MYTVADRDFVYFRGKKTMDDGRKMIYATFSVDRHDVEIPRGVVRAWIHFSGWFIELIDKPDEKDIKGSGYKDDGDGPWVRLTYTGMSFIRGLHSMLRISFCTLKHFILPPFSSPHNSYYSLLLHILPAPPCPSLPLPTPSSSYLHISLISLSLLTSLPSLPPAHFLTLPPLPLASYPHSSFHSALSLPRHSYSSYAISCPFPFVLLLIFHI